MIVNPENQQWKIYSVSVLSEESPSDQDEENLMTLEFASSY